MEVQPDWGPPQNAADRLRAAIQALGLSQRAAAKELGVDERTMRYWCSGKYDPPAMAFMALEHLAAVHSGKRAALPRLERAAGAALIASDRQREIIDHFLGCAERCVHNAERPTENVLERELFNLGEAQAALQHVNRVAVMLDLSELKDTEALRQRAHELRQRAQRRLDGDQVKRPSCKNP